MNPPDYGGDGLYIYMYPSPVTGGSRHGELPWLEERYDVLTGVAWSSPVELHPETAQSLGLRDGDVVAFAIDETVLQAPVVLYHGIRRDTVGMPIGPAASQAVRQAVSSRFNAAGDPMLNCQRVTLRKNGHRALAKVGATLSDLGRGLAILERRPA
jgi:anaerobic selenocysteine-containing dehydrogenase